MEDTRWINMTPMEWASFRRLDFAWDSLTSWHFNVLKRANKNFRQRFSTFLLFYRNGVPPDQAGLWTKLSMPGFTDNNKHIDSLVATVKKTPHVWDKVPTFDVYLRRVLPMTGGTRFKQVKGDRDEFPVRPDVTMAERELTHEEELDNLIRRLDDLDEPDERARRAAESAEASALDELEARWRRTRLRKRIYQSALDREAKRRRTDGDDADERLDW